jgi:ArsR family transcriptional regulator
MATSATSSSGMLTANLRQGQALLEALDGAEDAVALADSARTAG